MIMENVSFKSMYISQTTGMYEDFCCHNDHSS